MQGSAYSVASPKIRYVLRFLLNYILTHLWINTKLEEVTCLNLSYVHSGTKNVPMKIGLDFALSLCSAIVIIRIHVCYYIPKYNNCCSKFKQFMPTKDQRALQEKATGIGQASFTESKY